MTLFQFTVNLILQLSKLVSNLVGFFSYVNPLVGPCPTANCALSSPLNVAEWALAS